MDFASGNASVDSESTANQTESAIIRSDDLSYPGSHLIDTPALSPRKENSLISTAENDLNPSSNPCRSVHVDKKAVQQLKLPEHSP